MASICLGLNVLITDFLTARSAFVTAPWHLCGRHTDRSRIFFYRNGSASVSSDRHNPFLKGFVSPWWKSCENVPKVLSPQTSTGKVSHHGTLPYLPYHYNDVTMSKIASQITSLTIVYSTVYSGPHRTKHQSSASLAFVWWIHRIPVNSPHKWPVTRKMFSFDDVIMCCQGVLSPIIEGIKDRHNS